VGQANPFGEDSLHYLSFDLGTTKPFHADTTEKINQMILRIIIILIGVFFFVNGCSSLVSSVAGTHKLRTLSMQEVRQSGVGDADYVEITGAWSSGAYIFEPHRRTSWPGFVQWPVLSATQLDSLEQGRQVTVEVYAWTKRYDKTCVEAENCVKRGSVPLKGLIRPLNKKFNKMASFPDEQYLMAENPVFIEYNRQPLAWYWNLGIMLLAAALILLVEQQRIQKERSGASTKTS
jgi:hypothetical protein